ncbi:hypothetical protein [Streptomyces sp. PSKA30]|uniref:hypothetical protein n=1 Tax=Streptomyces sp. PSKA30 TaxID=2874597 RepID=UPI001CD0E87B|nr:hypothetical protein [Streptomyces sp. PSKA30]MBZ9641114.1 hypothetical protein [Streptomyces sp. PSKA30]
MPVLVAQAVGKDERVEGIVTRRPSPRSMAIPVNQAEFDAMAAGIGYRVLYEQAFFDDAGAVDNVVRAVRAGEVARAVPALPLRMAIADRCLAVCPLAPAGPASDPRHVTAAVIRGSSLLEALVALFERYWEIGVPPACDAGGPARRIRPGERLRRAHGG